MLLALRPTTSSAPRLRMLLLLGLLAGLGGCVSNGSGDGPVANAQASMQGSANGATVAFESVDGPPPHVFDRLVNLLDSEAKLRSIAVVSREEQTAFRVRTYLAAVVRGGRTSVAWVWDVYDRNQQRTMRLSGEEPAGKSGGDAWALADDLVLRRIAQAGFTGLGNLAGGTLPASPVPATPDGNRVIASATEKLPAQTAFANSHASMQP